MTAICAPLQLLAAAESIAEKCKVDASWSEPVLRAIVSRVYYACYHHALAMAQDAGFSRTNARNSAAGAPNVGDHELLIRYMEKSQQMPLRQCAVKLNKMRKHRKTADYELDKAVPVTVTQIFDSAKKLMV